jgi:hypothetical protein
MRVSRLKKELIKGARIEIAVENFLRDLDFMSGNSFLYFF